MQLGFSLVTTAVLYGYHTPTKDLMLYRRPLMCNQWSHAVTTCVQSCSQPNTGVRNDTNVTGNVYWPLPGIIFWSTANLIKCPESDLWELYSLLPMQHINYWSTEDREIWLLLCGIIFDNFESLHICVCRFQKGLWAWNSTADNTKVN